MKKISVSKWWILLILFLSLSTGMCIVTYKVKSRTFITLKENLERIQDAISRLKYRPDDTTLQQLRTVYRMLLEKDTVLYSRLSSFRIPHSDLTPLEFKERLMDTADQLNKLAEVQGTNIPPDIGFPRYTSGSIPTESEVPVLYKELMGIEVILKILLKYKVEDIEIISRDEAIGEGPEGSYKEYRFKFKFKVNYPALVSIMQEIFTTSNLFFVVERLEINRVEGDKNITTLVLGLIDFDLKSFK